jgi:hypothetical protein
MKITVTKPRTLVFGAFLLLSLLFSNQAVATISTFDSGLESWNGNGCLLSWDQTDGNPQPALRTGDTDVNWAQIIAPTKFHGRWSTTGVVSADIKYSGTTPGLIYYPPAFAITDGNTTYQYIFTALPTTGWKTFSAPLTDQKWTRVTNNNEWGDDWYPPIGTETLVQVLKNVTDFRIRTDYTDDSDPAMDAADLDNIKAPLILSTPALTLLLLD